MKSKFCPKWPKFHPLPPLIVLPTLSLHIEMVVSRTPIIIECVKLDMSIGPTGIKVYYKIDKFAFEGNKSKVVRGTVLT